MALTRASLPSRILALLWAGCVPLAAACAIGAITAWFWTRPASAAASSTWSAYTVIFTAEGLLDGSPRSIWSAGVLPAYVDIDLRERRALRVVTVTNSDDFPHHDTSSDSFRLQLFDGDREVFAERRRFASPTSRETFAVDAIADRIRVTVESSRGARGCLADVSWQ